MAGTQKTTTNKKGGKKAAAKKTAAPGARGRETVAALKRRLAERELELAILNSVGEAMARELDLQSITRVMGDKVRDIFQTEVASIFFYDEANKKIQMVYSYDRGYVQLPPPLPLGKGLSSHVILSRQPLLLGTAEEADALNSVNLPNAEGDTGLAQSWLGVPIVVGEKVVGLVSVEDYKRNAYDESSVQLLSTLTAALGVAIQNARLFDETRRLLKETEERNAELAIINSVQEALAAKMDIVAMYEMLGEKIRSIFDAQVVLIATFDHQAGNEQFHYVIEKGERFNVPPRPIDAIRRHIIATRQALLINDNFSERVAQLGGQPNIVPGTEYPQSLLFVPLVSDKDISGYISLQNIDHENAFRDSDVQLLSTLANSMSVALESARLFDETQRLFKAEQQRAAELAVISSIQQGLAAELNFQAIIDLVGDKLREVLGTGDIGIRWYDDKVNMVHYLYEYEHGQRITIPSAPPLSNTWFRMMQTRQPVTLNTRADMQAFGIVTVPGTDQSMSLVTVPIVGRDRMIGAIIIEDYEQEGAYSESDVRLLQTVASSMGVALENARLFDETQRLFHAEQQRATELQIINSVQDVLASKLNEQEIYNLVGDRIAKLFDAQTLYIMTLDPQTNMEHYPYMVERGKRQYQESLPHDENGFSPLVMRTHKPIIVNENMAERSAEVGSIVLADGELSKSGIWVPIIVRNEARGVISAQNIDREHAFTDADISLLTTIANSMSVALENARLFDETQRLLKETAQRAEELQIVNSVQAMLDSRSDMQSIYNLVGDKVRDIFDAQTVVLTIYDKQTNLTHYPYIIENGERLHQSPIPLDEGGGGFGGHVIRTRKPLVVNRNFEEESLKFRSYNLGDNAEQDTIVRSGVWVPLIVGEEVKGVLSLQNLEREDAFSNSDVRLLITLANSMSAALENVRLFNETQRLLNESKERNAELAVINSLQEALAVQLDMQGIYTAVGDKLREIFTVHAIDIVSYDPQTNLITDRYVFERGEQYWEPPRPPYGFRKHIIETRQPLMFNRDVERIMKEYGNPIIVGSPPRSCIFVPLAANDQVTGIVSVQNLEEENSYDEADLRLLTTLANSMTVALENARLFNETQRLLKETEQRASELTIINRVLAGLDSRGEIQAMYDLVGNKINEIFATHTTVLMIYDRKTNQLSFPYIMERGVRLHQDPIPFPETGGGFSAHVIRTGQPMMVNENFAEESRKYQSVLMGESKNQGIAVQSGLWVPLMVGEEARGAISLQNLEREHAFKESDERLLSTLANSLGITLESARLFDETQRLLKETEVRNAELAVINSVQQSLAVQLDMQGIYDAVGDKIREIFGQCDVGIRIYDAKTNVTHYPYLLENGRRIAIESSPHSGRGFEGYVFRTREVILINQNMKEEMERYDSYFLPGTEQELLSKSVLMVPLIYGEQARGLISLSDNTRENAFSASDVRLLQTLANSMGAALENARLFNETQRLLKETEQRASELAIINSVQKSLVSKLDLQAIIDLVGEKIWQIFDAQVVLISLYSPKTSLIEHRYILERGERLYLEHPLPVDRMRARVILERQTWLINENYRAIAQELGEEVITAGEEPKSLLFVPLIVGQEVTGVISLQNLDHEHAFAASEVRLIQTIANGMSVAIENARLFDETQRLFDAERQAHEQAETLRSIAHALNASLSLSEVFNLVLTEIQKVIPYDSAAIFEVQNNRRSFVAGRGFENIEELIGLSFEFNPQDDEIGYRISRSLQPLILDDAMASYPQYFSVGPHAKAAIHSYMGVPIIFNNQMTGMITLDKHEVGFYNEEYAKIALAFGAQAATALNNARLFEEANRRARETAVLNEVGRDISSTLELAAVMDKIAIHARDLLSASTSAIYLPDDTGKKFRAIAAKGMIAEEIMADTVTAGEGIIGTLAQQGRGEYINDTNNDPRTVQIPGTDMVSEERLMVAPLLTANKVIGMMAVWREGGALFKQADFDFLEELSLQAAIAIKNANYFDQIKQRIAELGTLNSASEAMSKSLDVKTVTRVIGDTVRDTFNADSVIIAMLDHATNLIHHMYVYDRQEGGYVDYIKPFPLGVGITSKVIESRQPINLGTAEEQYAHGGYLAPEVTETARGVQETQSWMGTPIIVGDKVVGVVNVQSYKTHAYTEDNLRLLQTLSANMGVSIENARLFDETQRLLKETEQRNAELQILNDIGEVLTRDLDLQTTIDQVGDKLRELVGGDNVGIGLYDPTMRIVNTLYVYKKDERLQTPSFIINDFTYKAAMQGKSLVFNKYSPSLWKRLGPQMTVDGQIPKSVVMVPMAVGKTLVGGISVQTFEREGAYSESFVKLLESVASNMATAIQNARLFDETKRRAAELATINTVSTALTGTLELKTIIELVGEQIRAAFHADIAYVALLDSTRQTINFSYQHGEELHSLPLGQGITSKVIEGGRPILINQNLDKRRVEMGATMAGKRRAQSYLGVPIFIGGQAIGALSVQCETQENAFTENDQRLLSAIAANVGVAIQNARLFEEAEDARRAAEEANHAKSAFLANMSHELRTPLNAIIGFTRIVRRKADGSLPEKQLDNLDKVLSSGEHLLNLINTVLDIAKIEAGRMEVQAANFNLEALGDQCMQTAQPLIKPGVRLEKDFDAGQLLIYSDQDKIKQVILNLLSNAAKFTHTGRVRLSIRREGSQAIVAVSDTGIGINKEALERIFEEFQQADTSTTRKYGGTGLGLSISRSLARLLGGELTAVSEPGHGATFTLVLPTHFGDASASLPDPARGEAQEAGSARQPRGRHTVLVIDDDPDAVYLLQESLSQAYEIVGATSGLEGQKKARELRPRAILLDIMLPDKDGWQVLHDLKQDARTADIPVILLTIVDKKALGFRLGASAYLLKPLDPEAVMSALRSVTEKEGRPARHVLVVDDDPHVADMLRQILPESEFKLDAAPDGMAGLDAIARQRPDVLLLDLMMPRLDGFGVIERLRSNPQTQDLPIIVISAKELTSEESIRLKESAIYVMRKQGFDSERLLSEINKALETNK